MPRDYDNYLRKYKCKNCGKIIWFAEDCSVQICDYCHKKVYRNNRIEFYEELRKELRKNGNNKRNSI